MINATSVILQDAWRQCERHLHFLRYAMQSLKSVLPFTTDFLINMDDERVQDWDQFILRYTKLQDTIGARLFPAVLAFLEEPFEDRPMLDKLHRLEKLGYLESMEQWHTLRSVRNSFAHDYPQDDALKVAYLNQAIESVPIFENILARVRPLVTSPVAQQNLPVFLK